MAEYINREEAIKELYEVYEQEYPTASGNFDEYASHDVPNVLRNIPAADVQPIYYAENVQNEVLNYLFNKEREAESMSYGDKRQERIVTIREIIRFVEDIDPRMDGDTNG